MGDHHVSSSSPASPDPEPPLSNCKHAEVKEVFTESKSRHVKKVVKLKICCECSKVLRKYVSTTYEYQCNKCYPTGSKATNEDWTDSDEEAELAHGLSFCV